MTRIAMTGASGRYGRLATDKLIAQGRARDLILITRTPAKLADRAREGCEGRYGGVEQPETLQVAFSGAGKLLLISGTRVGARVRQHKAAIDAAAAAGVGHIVYTSFVNVDPANPAIVTIDHRETENLIKASGAAYTFLREPVDDQTVAGIPWNSDDMVSFERSIREGFLDVCTDDVLRLTGRRARSVRELIEANADFLRGVKP